MYIKRNEQLVQLEFEIQFFKSNDNDGRIACISVIIYAGLKAIDPES